MTDVRIETNPKPERVWGSQSAPTVSWRVLARKPDNPDAFLLVDGEDDTEPYPRLARVLDRALLRLYPPYATQALVRASEWEILNDPDEVPAEPLLEHVHIEPIDPFHERFMNEPARGTSSGDLDDPLDE